MANTKVLEPRKIVALSIHPSIHDQLRELAVLRGVSMSRLVEILIKEASKNAKQVQK